MTKNSNNIVKITLLRWWHFFIYKPNSKDIYLEKIISSIVVILGFAIWGFFNNKRLNALTAERNKYAHYTIGITTDYHNNIRSSYTDIDYKYYVGNFYFTGSGSVPWLSNNVKKVNGRYYVQFDSNNPKNSKILFNQPVPDGILHAPDTGWSVIP